MKKIINTLIVSVLMVAPVIRIDIDVKSSFGLGEQIYFDYILESDENETVFYIPYIFCPDAPYPLLEERRADLQKGIVFEDSYYGLKVDERTKHQTCTASIDIRSPVQKRVEKEFEIVAEPGFEFRLLICKDAGCQERSKVYQVGERLYLNYEAEVKDAEISAGLTKPDGKEIKVELAEPVLLAEEGTYVIEASASKKGYKTMMDVVEINVVKEFAPVIDTRLCNTNGKCEPLRGEDYKNCPGDCLSPTQAKEELERIRKEGLAQQRTIIMKAVLLVLAVLAIAALAVVIALRYWRRKSSNYE